MRINKVYVATYALFFVAPLFAQADPQQPPSPSSQQMTVPEAQRPQEPRRLVQQPPQQAQARTEESAAGRPQRQLPPAEEKSVVTHHTARIAGQTINYTATAATYIIKADDGTPKATMFYAAYTKDDVANPAQRPVSFVYNGGPGSASLFTHMGMGPRTVVLTPDGHGMPAPYSIADNDYSFLDATDLVFIDAISTGYSRPAPGETPAQFHGVIADATGFPISFSSTSRGTDAGLRPNF